MGRFTCDTTTLKEVLADTEGATILKKYLGSMLSGPVASMFKNKTMNTCLDMGKAAVGPETVEIIKQELEALP